jgi:hypothetical protein
MLTLRNEEPQRERRVLHQKIALCVGVLALSLTASGSASAHPAPQPYYPGAARPGTAVLPPHEILAIMRSTGLEPLSSPLRFGPVYVLRAVNPSSREVKVIVDARSGRILKVHPVLLQRYVLPPSYGRPPGQTANVPDGYGANSRIAAKPPSVEGPPVRGLAAGALPAVPVPVAAPPRPTAQAGPPPLPRPRPKLAAAESTPATIAAPQALPPQALPPQALPPQALPPQAAPLQVEAKDTREQPKESESTGAITPAAPAPAPVEAHELCRRSC